MTNDRPRRDPREQAAAPPVPSPADSLLEQSSNGRTSLPNRASDSDDAGRVPSAFSAVPVASGTRASMEGEWLADELVLESDESPSEGPSQGQPVAAPPSSETSSELQPEDRGVAITLPPGLATLIRGVARTGSTMRRPAAVPPPSGAVAEPDVPRADSRSQHASTPSNDRAQATGPWNAAPWGPGDDGLLEQSELPLSPDTLRPIDDSAPVHPTRPAQPSHSGAHVVARWSGDAFGEPAHEPAYGIQPVDPPIPFRQPVPVREVSKASTGRFERIPRTPTPVVVQREVARSDTGDAQVAGPGWDRIGGRDTAEEQIAASKRITTEREVTFAELAAMHDAGIGTRPSEPNGTDQFPSSPTMTEPEGHAKATQSVPAVTEPEGHAKATQSVPAVTEPEMNEPEARKWMRLADLARQAGEPAATVMDLLERSVRAYPTSEALQQIEVYYAAHEPAALARRNNLAGLAEVAERPYQHVVEVGRQLLEQHPRQAWCALAPLLTVRQGEDELRLRLRELRRDHERPPLLVADDATRRRLFPQGTPGHAVALLDALRCIEAEAVMGAHSTAELDAQETFEVSRHSPIGRTFAAIAKAMGLPGASLHRANVLPEPWMVWFRDQTVAVVLRSDILQTMVRAEIGFVLVSALELAQPGGRVLAATTNERRRSVVAAIRQGLHLPAGAPHDPAICSIVQALSAD
ncbi:MAG: hypothetical protein KGO50_18155, partial [Myxococcales bacterium]|nr:hypothetical protein [Myxococcales bacterium]